MQTKLNNFFKVSVKSTSTNKNCFVYSPQSRQAFFTTSSNIIEDTDLFICSKSGLKLYHRQHPSNYNIPNKINNPKNYSIPLLKSNLQKAVRRCKSDIAISTSLYLIQNDLMSFLRRLPIIVIEDVCLIDSFPTIIWFMIAADKDYKLTSYDIDILLNIVWNLCNIHSYYEDDVVICERELNHQLLENEPNNSDILLAIYYRSLYGGMGGDMKMLRNSIEYYIKFPEKIIKTTFNNINYERISNTHIDIIPESIDFHPFPHMIEFVKQNSGTSLPNQKIKEIIWFSLSGVNIRKKYTLDNSEKYSTSFHWRSIKHSVEKFQNSVIENV